MADNITGNDPLSFMRNLWGNMGGNMGSSLGGFNLPGIMTPTFDVKELDKRIEDLKAVEGWLRMNLSMLQMSIQGMEMQRATLSVVQAMGDMASQTSDAAAATPASAFTQAFTPPLAPEAPAEATSTLAGENAEAMSQAALWPWKMMQQVQEAMQQQAKPEEPAPAASKPKGRSGKNKT